MFGKKVTSVLSEKSQVLLTAKNVEELKVMTFYPNLSFKVFKWNDWYLLSID